jgi:alpha-L-fucosidase
MGAAALAMQTGSIRALSGTADRLAWQREAKFGMFIHWGPYSVAGVEASWPIMVPTGEISEPEYRALPDRFNPVRFDPKEWIDLARKCGQRYMVFTAKHHDGFCMFDSEYTNSAEPRVAPRSTAAVNSTIVGFLFTGLAAYLQDRLPAYSHRWRR